MNKPSSELIARLEASQRACFDAGLHVAAMDIQSARAEIARTAANQSGSERAGVDANCTPYLSLALQIIHATGGDTKRADEAASVIAAFLATPPAQPAPAATHGKPDGAVRQLEPWQFELDEVIGHLGAAIHQSVASDDQIIMDHVKAAHEIAKIVRRKA